MLAAYHVLAFASPTADGLDELRRRLLATLRATPDRALAPLAWTLLARANIGAYRAAVIARDAGDAATVIEDEDPRRMITATHAGPASLVFAFPGGGSQYPSMGRDLYASEPIYRREVDRGIALHRARTGVELGPLMFPADDRVDEAARELERPSVQLPAIFVVALALTELLRARGVVPDALVGHSVGENIAACVAGVLGYEDALGLVALRGRLLERAPGTMTSVALAVDELAPWIRDLEVDLAAVNAPAVSVVAGAVAAIAALEQRLVGRAEFHRVHIRAAPHSRALDALLPEFRAYLDSIALHAPAIPFASNLTGAWVTEAECRDPAYWVQQFRRPVLFAAGLDVVCRDRARFFLEVGPGRVLTSLVGDRGTGDHLGEASSLRHPKERIADTAYLLAQLARLWAWGGRVDLASLIPDADRVLVELDG